MLANYETTRLCLGNGCYRTYCPAEDEENYDYCAYDSVEFDRLETYAGAGDWDD